MADLTERQRSMLRHVALVGDSDEWDGYAPHGASDWRTIRSLESLGLVRCDGPAECGDGCERAGDHPHQVSLFVMTDEGHRVVEAFA